MPVKKTHRNIPDEFLIKGNTSQILTESFYLDLVSEDALTEKQCAINKTMEIDKSDPEFIEEEPEQEIRVIQSTKCGNVSYAEDFSPAECKRETLLGLNDSMIDSV